MVDEGEKNGEATLSQRGLAPPFRADAGKTHVDFSNRTTRKYGMMPGIPRRRGGGGLRERAARHHCSLRGASRHAQVRPSIPKS
jgi:hypothetical protein